MAFAFTCGHFPFDVGEEGDSDLDLALSSLALLVASRSVGLEEVAAAVDGALIVVVDACDAAESVEEAGEVGVAVAAAKAADIERIAAAEEDSAESLEKEDALPMEGAEEEDNAGEREEDGGEGNEVWWW